MFDDMPRRLSHFNVFLDAGLAFFGRCEELTLPKIALDTQEYRSGGMDTPLVADKGIQKLEAHFTMATFEDGVIRRFGIKTGGPISVVVRGALTLRSISTPIACFLRGIITELDFGTWKGGDDTKFSFAMVCSYYRLSFNEMEVIEIDVPNMIRRIDGVDQLLTARLAILKV